MTLTTELAGSNCTYAGTRIDAGPDTSRDGVLQSSEITATSYVCNPTPAGLVWVNVTGINAAAAPNRGYLANNAAEVFITLPDSSQLAIGDVVRVNGVGTGGWKLLQQTGQSIATSALNLTGSPGVGEFWRAQAVAGIRDWTSIASSADGIKLVATVANGKIYTSSNSGLNWTAQDSNRQWTAVASSSDGSNLVAGVSGGQIYTSSDSGLNWTARDSNRQWNAVASSSNGSKLVATDRFGSSGAGQIYTSSDSGMTWTAREMNRQWTAVASSSDGSKLVATVSGGLIYTSTDSGRNWTARDSNRPWTAVASSSDGNKLVATVSGGLIYMSTDSGRNWTARDSNRPWTAVASSSDGSKLVATDLGGFLYSSADSGLTWAARDDSRQWSAIASSSSGNKLAATASNGYIYTSASTRVKASTTPGPRGGISGAAGSTIELQYTGGDVFNILSTLGTLSVE